MRCLFLADVVGKSGRKVIKNHLDELREKFAIDKVIVNGENSAHGKGITKKIYEEFCNLNIDVITMGNHTFSKGEIYDFIEDAERLVVPCNLLPGNIGHFYKIIECGNIRLAVVNLCCESWMNNVMESPFNAMQHLLDEIQDVDGFFVDLHGESTGEKILFANVFKNQCVAIIGTHTHVQTADECILEGCAFISDAGMCGAYKSVLGRDLEEVIENKIRQNPTHYKVASGPAVLCGVVIEIDEKTKRAISIERVQIRPE